ncbi:unnamed protein product [Paramecium octaurelia]|uniref:Uncharacterized protein n=1 Tax=Paramecium octaurelia TaxID=43137 RepID=A0A8S1SD71_PAROT|nr:unnamed protein product [Paramecium octaurelia]
MIIKSKILICQSKQYMVQGLKFAIISLLSTSKRDDNANSLQSMNSTGWI